MDVSALEKLIIQGKVKYIFICGLGEPTAPENIDKFKAVLQVAQKHNCKVSAFTNIVALDEQLFQYIEDKTLNVKIKLDSFKPEKVRETFGIGTEQTKTYFENLERIRKIARANDEPETQIAASVVFTQENFDEAEEVIVFCLENGIYPLLGELEEAGRCVGEVYLRLKLTDEQTQQILKIMEKYGVKDYRVAHCPANYGALHITGANEVLMDEETGLGCKWFSLKDNNVCKKVSFGNISGDETTWQDFEDKVFKYRFMKHCNVLSALKNLKETDTQLIGGCGGPAKQVLETHIDLNMKAYRSRKNNKNDLEK